MPDAPRRRKGVRIAIEYFQDQRVPHSKWLSILKATDLSKKLVLSDLSRGDVLVSYRRRHRKYGDFYTKIGTASSALGIVVDGRKYCRYFVKKPFSAMESTTAAYQNVKKGSGGGQQYYIPRAYRYLNLVYDGEER